MLRNKPNRENDHPVWINEDTQDLAIIVTIFEIDYSNILLDKWQGNVTYVL